MLLNTKLVTRVELVQSHPRCTGRSCSSASHHSGLSARSLHDNTHNRTSVSLGRNGAFIDGRGWKRWIERETDGGGWRCRVRKRKKEGEGEKWGRKGFNDAENWPVSADYPLSKSLLQLPVNLSVLLSSPHRTPAIHSLTLFSLTNFMRWYSKLPSPHHIRTVTINKGLH